MAKTVRWLMIVPSERDLNGLSGLLRPSWCSFLEVPRENQPARNANTKLGRSFLKSSPGDTQDIMTAPGLGGIEEARADGLDFDSH